MIVGVTGLYCAGKSAVSERLGRAGFHRIEVDRLGHQALEEKRDAIVDRFGRLVLDDQGRISRKKLGDIVFSDPHRMAELEGLIHPVMVEMCRRLVSEHNRSDEIGKSTGKTVIDAALLYHMGLNRLCNLVVVVKAPLLVRCYRALVRDRLTFKQIVRRFWFQRKLSIKNRAEPVDTYTITNCGTRKHLDRQVRAMLNYLETQE